MAEFDAFDLLPAQIAVLDRDGGIAFTNHAWNQTAEGRLPDRRWNYLEECAAAADRGCTEARAVGTGLGRVIAGELDRFVAVYNCRSTTGIIGFKCRPGPDGPPTRGSVPSSCTPT